MDGFAANSHGSDLSADQEPFYAPTSSVRPHPRHAPRSLHTDAWYQIGYQQQHDYQFHLVDDDDKPAAHHDNRSPAPINDSSSSGTGDDTAGSSSDRLSPRDRDPRPQTLRPIRYRRGGLVRRYRLAGIELPTGRHKPYGMSGIGSVGLAPSCRPVHGTRARLAYVMDRSRRQSRGRCAALCVLGTVTLATLIGKVL